MTLEDGSDPASNTTESTPPRHRRFDWDQFRFAVAVLLFAAAMVKIFNMQQILTGSGLLRTMPRLVAVLVFEAALSTFLIVGNRLWSWLLTLTTFSVFVTSAVYAMATDQSCHCFGKQLTPEIVVVVDTVVLLFTGIVRPRSWRTPTQSLARQLIIVAVLGGLFAVLAGWRYEGLLQAERSRLLLAELLIGKPWPLDGKIDPPLAALSSGKWMILIAREDCVHCRNLVARHFADPETHRTGERTAVFVFGGADDRWRYQIDRVTMDSSGDAVPYWPNGEPQVINPAVFVVNDGLVVDAAEGEATEQFLNSLLNGPEPSAPH